MRRVAFLIPCVVLTLSAADQPPKPKQDPPDRTAFRAAGRIQDPGRKIDALRQFIHNFPKSMYVNAANDDIFETLVKQWPESSDEDIRRQGWLVINRSKKNQRTYMYDDNARTLADNRVMLDLAESWSHAALASLDERKFIERVKKNYQEAKVKPPDDAALKRSYGNMRASFQTTLGLVYLGQGEDSRAQALLKQAYATDPNLGRAAEALAEIALKNGNEAEAFDDLLSARLAGNVKQESYSELRALYAKRNGGSMSGFDDMLDREYRKRYPDPVKVEPYKADQSRSDRVVLVEVFTGAGCPPCAGADLAMDAALERYPRKDVAILMFHQHVPHPDPMTNPDTVKRAKFYEVQGVPSWAIDGEKSGGGSDRTEAKSVYDRFDPNIEKDLDKPAEAHIALTATRDGDVVKVHAIVDAIKSDSKDLTLQIALLERRLRYSGENGIRFHPMVVRGMAGKDNGGFAVASGKTAEFDCSFDLAKISSDLKKYLDDYEQNNDRYGKFTFSEEKYAIDPANLAVAAFVQDSKTRHVLQATYEPLSGSALRAGESQ